MDRPNLQGRVPDTITTRLPGGESDDPEDATGGSSADDTTPDTDGSDSSQWTTLLTLSGLGLAALGVVLRYALDRRGESDDEADRDGPDFEGSVEVVGDTGAIDVADETPSDATADENDTDEVERDESAGDADTEPAADVAVETFEPDRATDEADGDGVESQDGDAAADREGPPRIAPLVGMVALVGVRLFVERVRKRYAESPEAAGQL